MNTQEIARLLEKYYDGTSSEKEELAIRKYFESSEITEDLQAERELFRYYSSANSDSVSLPSEDLGERIIDSIDVLEASKTNSKQRQAILAFTSVAAGLLLLAGSYFLIKSSTAPKDTYSDPHIAYSQAVKILYKVSAQLNKGTEALEPVRKLEDSARKSLSTIAESTSAIEDNLKNLDYFQRAINMVSFPMEIGKNK